MLTKRNTQTRASAGAGNPEGAAHDEAIRNRAYELFLSRSAAGLPGDPLSDWVQAERAVMSAQETVTSDRSSAGQRTPGGLAGGKRHDAK